MKNNDQNMAAFNHSLRLWPDTSLSPRVPPQETLMKYLELPNSVEEDLRDQIEESMDCYRALEEIRLNDGILADIFPEDYEPQIISAEMVTKLNAARTTSNMQALPSPKAQPTAIKAGQIWTTSSQVEHFNAPIMVSRTTFRPQTIVLLDDPQEMPTQDQICRALIISEKESVLYPNSADSTGLHHDKQEWIVHLFLHYPVSTSQLTYCKGAVSKESLAEIRQKVEAYESLEQLEELTEAEILERERLLDLSSFIPANADSRLQRWQLWQSFSNHLPTTFKSQEVKLAAADITASRELHDQLFKIVGTDIIIEIAECIDPAQLALSVIEGDQAYLENAEIFTDSSTQKASAIIKDGQALLPRPSDGSFFIRKETDFLKLELVDAES